MDTVRVSNISQLAGAPFTALRTVRGIVYQENSPTENARLLREGKVDAALMPIVDFLADGRFQSLEFGLGCRARSQSMMLYANAPLETLSSVRVYSCSSSSRALLQLLLREEFGTTPEIIRDRSLDGCAGISEREGALVLHELPGTQHTNFSVAVDLAAEWHRKTKLPFVFLVWAVRPGTLTSDQLGLLTRWLYRGTKAARFLARSMGSAQGASPDRAEDFVAGDRRYRLDDFLLGGLEEFIIQAQRQGDLRGVRYATAKRCMSGEIALATRSDRSFASAS